MGLRGRLKRLEREARGDLVRVDQGDGRVLYFERMEVLKALFLHSYDAALGLPPEPSAVMDALEYAPERPGVEARGGGTRPGRDVL